MLIISDDSRQAVGRALREAACRANREVVYFAADTLDIRPCAACGSCSGKTYGRCIIQDDMQQVLPEIAGCRALVLVSPLVFGGVSCHIKKVMDRMAAVGNPRYHISGGELVKGMSGEGMDYYLVGVGDQLSEAERAAFLFLHEENRRIMNVTGRAFIISCNPDGVSIDQIVQGVSDE